MIIFWYVSCFASRFCIQGIMIFIRDWRTVASVQCVVNKPCKLPIPVRWCDEAFTENESDSVLIPIVSWNSQHMDNPAEVTVSNCVSKLVNHCFVS